MTIIETKPFGNLTFSDYTLGTEAEKLLLQLEAALRVGEGGKSALSKVAGLKKAMIRSKKYTFDLIPTPRPAVKKECKFTVDNDCTEQVGKIVAHHATMTFRKKKVSYTSTHVVCVVVCSGSQDELRLATGVERRITEDIGNLPNVKSVVVSPIAVKLLEDRKCLIHTRVIYRLVVDEE
jgi:hypothetical protein